MFRTTHTNDTSATAGDPVQLSSVLTQRPVVTRLLQMLGEGQNVTSDPPQNNKVRMSNPSSHHLMIIQCISPLKNKVF